MKKWILVLLLSPVALFPEVSLTRLKSDLKYMDNTQKTENLITLAEKYQLINIDSSLRYCRWALDLSKRINNDSLYAISSYTMGNIYIYAEKYDKALEYSKYALDFFMENQDTTRFLYSLFDMGIIYTSLSNYELALEYYEEILLYSRLINDESWIASAISGIGTSHFLMGNYNSALIHLDSSLTMFKKLNLVNKFARSYYGIGAVYMAISKYDKALDYLIKSIKVSIERKQSDYTAMSNHAISVIYEKLKNYSMAITFNDAALKIANQINDKYLIGSFLNHSGEIYLHLAKTDTALMFANKALRIEQEILNKVGIAHSYDLRGNIFLKKRQYYKALENFLQAKEILDTVDHKYRQTKTLIHLGIVYANSGKRVKAGNYLTLALNKAKKLGSQDLVMEGLSALANYYANLENYEKAYTYQSEFINLNDSVFTSSSHHIAEMQMRYETGKREKENELLKNELEIKKLEVEKSHLRNWITLLSLAIVSIIGFFSYNRYRAKKRATIQLERKVQDALQKQQKQQEIIFHQANLSSLGELAAGMAHEINQPLQAIKLSTESLDLELRELGVQSSTATENISEIYQSIDRARNIIDHVRIFASQQKNNVDEYFTPAIVVETALALVSKQYRKKDIHLNIRLNKRVGKIKGNPYKFEQIVFNLLANAKDALLEMEEKSHQSFKKEIHIKIFREDNDIVLLIRDNGVGMNKDQKDNIFSPFYTTKSLGEGTGLGLSIVFGLVKEMSGRIMVTSDISSGTAVHVRIPKADTSRTKHQKTSDNHY